MSISRGVMLLDDASIRKMWSSKNGLRNLRLTLGIQKRPPRRLRHGEGPPGRSEAVVGVGLEGVPAVGLASSAENSDLALPEE